MWPICTNVSTFVSVGIRERTTSPLCFSGVPPTSYLPAATTRFVLPLLPSRDLKGSLLYFDGQMNDSRFCLSLCLSPTVPGFVDGMKEAAAANYVRVKELLKDEHGKIVRWTHTCK